jgi:hypothetical protein
MSLLVLLSGSSTSQPDYSLPNLVLTAIYVVLTLVIAGAAIWSATITRKALKTSSELSRDALAASDRQSGEAIAAVNKQIEASEKQSKEAIAAVNRQIEASERQAQEALYNQHKPVIVPSSFLKTDDTRTFKVGMQNKGAGVALNAFGVMGIKDLPMVLCSSRMWFLAPDDKETFITFKVGVDAWYPYNVFEEVAVFPQVGARLMVTYNDAFSNKYFATFDYSDELEWKQVNEIKRVKQRLDELLDIRHKT